MNDHERQTADALVSITLRRKAGESLIEAAERVMLAPSGDPRWRVARAILASRPADPWSRMRIAAKAARRLRGASE